MDTTNRKKNRSLYTKIKTWIITMLDGEDPELIKSKKVVNQVSFGGGLSDAYLFDFKNWSSDYRGNGFIGGSISIAQADSESASDDQSAKEKKQFIKLRPIDVLKELDTIPNPFSILGIDDKIVVLKDKQKLIVQEYANREITGLIERLENRKKYNEFKNYFDQFQNTTDEKIELLIKNHPHLLMKTSDIFIPEFPDIAIKIMKEYTEQMDKLCGKKPVFYVIANSEDFKKAYKKRDPILCVQSPFGFFWQILGAWDEEMLLLSEL